MKAFKILVILIIALGIIYYQLDKHLFYYGKNDLHIYHLLPLKIEPEYRYPFEGGFALRDEYGFTIAAKGNTYPVNNEKILINRVLKYGFNAKDLVAVVIDANKTKYYVKFTQDQKDNSEVDATMDVGNKLDNLKLYKWIDIDGSDDYIRKLMRYRTYIMFVLIILFLTPIYKLVKYRKFGIR